MCLLVSCVGIYAFPPPGNHGRVAEIWMSDSICDGMVVSPDLWSFCGISSGPCEVVNVGGDMMHFCCLHC